MPETHSTPTAGRTPIGVALAQLAAEAPARPAGRPAVTVGDLTRTRADLGARTNRLARVYLQLGVRPGSFVTIAIPTGIEFLEAVIAAGRRGPSLSRSRTGYHRGSSARSSSSPTRMVVGLYG